MISQNGSRINYLFQKEREIGGREEERKERGKEGKTQRNVSIFKQENLQRWKQLQK